jgi:small-conductance mechanosensitive channel
VGVGFGLQAIVNNFVSGLILLFERRVQVGDRVQLADLDGDVVQIGIRASTVRTFDGADVIVPNSIFVTERVKNWTFSDTLRRIVVRVGVGYGSAPERVLEVLREAVTRHPKVLTSPAPLLLFRGFGESSLDFEARVFVDDYDRVLSISSELTLAIHGALKTAGIEIPFPQRDLHLRSVDAKAARALEGRGAPEKA